MRNKDLYDSDLNSEVERENFLSDDEPPQDHKFDKKTLKKDKDLKIYKQIFEVF